jgi:hypothetical protein
MRKIDACSAGKTAATRYNRVVASKSDLCLLADVRRFRLSKLGTSVHDYNPSNYLSSILSAFLALWLFQGCGGSATSSSGGNPNPTPTASSVDVVTYHYDNMRTGQNSNETALTTSNLTPTKFGKLGAFIVDGKVDAQPLTSRMSPFPVTESKMFCTSLPSTAVSSLLMRIA